MQLTSTRIAIIIGLAAGLLAIGVFFILELQARPWTVGIAKGRQCEAGQEDCRRAALREVAVGAPLPVFVAADFLLVNAYHLDSENITLPSCSDPANTAYYAYAHPETQGRVTVFELGGLNQISGMTSQQTPTVIEGRDNRVLVTDNLLECGYMGGEIVKVKP